MQEWSNCVPDLLSHWTIMLGLPFPRPTPQGRWAQTLRRVPEAEFERCTRQPSGHRITFLFIQFITLKFNQVRSTFLIAEGGEERVFFLEPKRLGAAIIGWPAVGFQPPEGFARRALPAALRFS